MRDDAAMTRPTARVWVAPIHPVHPSAERDGRRPNDDDRTTTGRRGTTTTTMMMSMSISHRYDDDDTSDMTMR
jgi:hypothetical protein